MLGLLDAELELADPRVTDERATPLHMARSKCRKRLERVQRACHLAMVTSPGVASLRLRMAASQLNPTPVVSHEPWTISELFTCATSEIGSAGGLIRRYAYLGHGGGAAKPEGQRGGLEPDVLAPFADPKIRWTFYAEAKQYSKACVPYLARGIREIADHLTRLRGTAFEVHEAFYMVFRLGGPLYHLPERVPLGDVTVYPVLIDIAEPKKSGSRQRVTPVVVTVEELVPNRRVDTSKTQRGARRR